MGKVLFAGTFNPYTIGHASVYANACDVFGEDIVDIGIATNPNKKGVNPWIRKWQMNPAFHAFESMRVKVIDQPMLADYATSNGYRTLVRSLRNSIDLVHEVDSAAWNKEFGINSVFVPTDTKFNHISSSAIREIDSLGKSVIPYFNTTIQHNRWTVKKPRRVIVVGSRMGCGKSSFCEDYNSAMYGVGENTPMGYVDMDKVVKDNLDKESTKLMRRFFEDTPIDDMMSHWRDFVQYAPAQAVKEIIQNDLDKDYYWGVFEISAFTAYQLDRFYDDSIIVYVSNYKSEVPKERDIDNEMMMKTMQLQKVPRVVDFVIDQQSGNVEEVVEQIRKTVHGARTWDGIILQ